MAVVCPAILAASDEDFSTQLNRVASFADRIQIDLTDEHFAESKTVDIGKIWWPTYIKADIHMMYQRPMEHLRQLVELRPHMVIIHAEADVHHMHMAAELHREGIQTGLAVLPETPIVSVEDILNSFDHLLIFSGDLGHFGGKANFDLLEKVAKAREQHEEIEVGWDGGVNDQNAKQLAEGGVDVLNAGGFIQKAKNPQEAYAKLLSLVERQK